MEPSENLRNAIIIPTAWDAPLPGEIYKGHLVDPPVHRDDNDDLCST